MGIYVTKPAWQRALGPIVALSVRRRVHPDVFTYGALVLSAVAALALLLAGADRLWLWLVPPCVLLRLVLNLMDGLVARARGMADRWGEVKNEFGDRIADALIFLALGLWRIRRGATGGGRRRPCAAGILSGHSGQGCRRAAGVHGRLRQSRPHAFSRRLHHVSPAQRRSRRFQLVSRLRRRGSRPDHCAETKEHPC